jgi:hypothetical protein
MAQDKEREMKQVKVQDAVGHILCHDITRIVPVNSRGRRSKRGT